MTGAPLPNGADAVVVVEDTDGSTDGMVEVRTTARLGQHIRRRGDDIAVGQCVVSRGEVLTPARLGLLASLGMPRVEVFSRPRVAILPTGSELVRPGSPLPPGAIYSSNDVALAALVRKVGATPWVHPAVHDDLESLTSALRQCLDADLVITTGGVSVGKFDHVKAAFEQVGVPMGFWKVQMKPGKPLAFGVAECGSRRVPVFGLPGNPVSCMVNFYQFVRPWLRASMGMPRPYLPVVEALVETDMPSKPGRVRFVRVQLTHREGVWRAISTGSQSSGVLTSMARADGLLIIAADTTGPHAGERVRVQVLDTEFLSGDAPAFGW
jgi:molybdenum cofactor synthesis domain-containing protein